MLLTTDDNPQNKKNRELFSSNGIATSRLEVSFYGHKLKNPNIYKDWNSDIFKSKTDYSKKKKKKILTDYKCFYPVKVEEYWNILYNGEE